VTGSKFVLSIVLVGLGLFPSEVSAQTPTAYNFCYPVSPIGPAGSERIYCPVEGDSTPGLTSHYNNRQHFLEYNAELGKFHLGEDWNGDRGGSTDYGHPVYAVANGVVTYVEDRAQPDGEPHSWGKVVVIRHLLPSGENVWSLYGHLAYWTVPVLCHSSSSPLCIVEQGQQIGAIGDGNGYYNGIAHLHLEIRKQFVFNNPEIIPGRAYIADDDDPFIAQHYHNPTQFIEALRGEGGSCFAPSGLNDQLAAVSCASAPSVATLAATNVTQRSATLNLSVNPNGSTTTVRFDWGTSSSLGSTTSSQNVGAGTTMNPASITLGSLSCDTLYYFRARAENGEGDATPGQIRSFRTDSCGVVGSENEELITNVGFESGSTPWITSGNFYISAQPCPYSGSRYAFLAYENGTRGDSLFGTLDQVVSIPATASAVDFSFRYSITTDDPSSEPKDVMSVWIYNSSGSSALRFLETYSNRDAQNGCGSSFYNRDSFSLLDFKGQTIRVRFLGTTDSRVGTPTVFRVDTISVLAAIPQASTPDVTTGNVDQVSASSARLNMTVDPNSDNTTVWFDLEAGDSSPSDDTEHVTVGAGSQPESVSISVFGLECATLYYYRAQATNSKGPDSGSVQSFRTSACAGGAPGADTDPAEDITQTSATLTADVDPNGLQTQAWFAWGSTPSLGQETPHVSVGSGAGNMDFSQTITGLICGTSYYFENHASNSAGQDDGVTLEFMTDPCDQPSQSNDLLLFASRQACAGAEPAVLLGWTMPQGADHLVTIRRSDGQPVATVNTAVHGPVHAIDSGFIFGNVYRFTVEAQVDGATVRSNELAVPITSDECRLSVAVGDRPHRPVLWAEPAFCENGVAKVRLFWTEATGAQFYSLQRVAAYIPTVTYNDLLGRSFVDELPAGGAAVYLVNAHNSSSVSSWNLGVIVPGTVCTTAGAPGPFSASAGSPVCEEGQGTVTVRWGQSAGAAADYRVYELYDHELVRFGDNADEFFDDLRLLDPGIVLRTVVQAESATTPGKFREAYPASKLIPLNVCGTGTAPPSAQGASASYIRADQALLKVSLTANRSDTSGYFEWGTSASYGFQTPTRVIGNKYSSVSFGEVLTGLACGTTYHFRVVASNAYGTTRGVDSTFTTASCGPGDLPVITVTASDATATENPMASGMFLIQRTGSTAGSLAVTYTVGGTATIGIDHTLASGSVTIPAGSASQTLAVLPLDDSLVESDETVVVTLQAQSQYAVGTPGNATVTLSSDDVAPPPGYPVNVVTGAVDSITETSAVLHGSANPNGAPTNGFFAYGIFPNMDHTVTVALGSDRTDQPFSIMVTGLSCGSEYYFLAVANNSFGESNAGAEFFRTADCATSASSFYTITPCRIVNTRTQNGPILTSGIERLFTIVGQQCGIPATAKSVSVNVTVVDPTAAGHLTLYPGDQTPPATSTINFSGGQIRANNAILRLSPQGVIGVQPSVWGSGQVHLLIDVNGYFE